jgi:hypothetical protein
MDRVNDAGWETPTPEEVSAAFDRHMTPEAEQEPEEQPEGGADQPTGDEPTPGEEDQAAPAGHAKGVKGAQKAAPGPQTYEIDGEQYTAEELAEWRKGYLRQQDYTRKTQHLSERDKMLDSLIRQNEQFLKAITRQNAPAGTEDEEPLAEAEALPPWAAELQKGFQEVRGYLESEREAAVQAQQDEYLMGHFNGALDRLMEENKVPAQLRPLYRSTILFNDPDPVDPVSGQVTPQSIQRAVRREFQKVHAASTQHTKQAIGGAFKNLKKEPRQTATPPQAPGTKPAAKPQAKGRRYPQWDTEANIAQVMGRLSEVTAPTED